jgi:DNA-binding response OmpR family regulator
VELTRTEFDVLAALSGRPRLAFTRRQLIDAVWGDGWVGDEHLVDVHVGHLRRKLGDDAAASKYIRTVRGVGYRMGDGTPPRNASGRR